MYLSLGKDLHLVGDSDDVEGSIIIISIEVNLKSGRLPGIEEAVRI
jgi:hypothetical protein